LGNDSSLAQRARYPLFLPVIEGAPSIVIATSFESGKLHSFIGTCFRGPVIGVSSF
jgi:hypothetical protein